MMLIIGHGKTAGFNCADFRVPLQSQSVTPTANYCEMFKGVSQKLSWSVVKCPNAVYAQFELEAQLVTPSRER
jgi:hypothetical protein